MSVQSHLTGLASELVLSDTERENIATSISTLRTRLIEHFGSKIKDQVQFGSSTRETILPRKADEHSDIDYMIVFDNNDSLKPKSFITRLKLFAEAKYSTSQIQQSHPTVVLSLHHIKFDLVPACKDWLGATQIPAPSTGFTDWISTYPNTFNSNLITKNKDNHYLIKPMIRLMKYWNARNGYVYDSYILEQALVDDSYFWLSSLKEYFFNAVENRTSWDLDAQWKKDKLQRAKSIVAETKRLEAAGYPTMAELEIKKLLPAL